MCFRLSGHSLFLGFNGMLFSAILIPQTTLSLGLNQLNQNMELEKFSLLFRVKMKSLSSLIDTGRIVILEKYIW